MFNPVTKELQKFLANNKIPLVPSEIKALQVFIEDFGMDEFFRGVDYGRKKYGV